MIVVLSLALLVSAEDEQPQFGRVVSLVGKVSATAGNSTRALARGDRLYKGDVLKTAESSQIQLLFSDRSVVSLGPSAELVLSKLEPAADRPKVGVKLVAGRVWARIQKFFGGGAAFSVETTNAVAGVRGTSIVVGVDGDSTQVAVERGEGYVTTPDGKEQTLPPMTQLTVTKDGAGEVVTLDAAALGDLLNGFSTGGGFGAENADGRTANAQSALTQTTDTPAVPETVGTLPSQNDTLAPVNIDPQQSQREAIINGTIEIVP